jgi:hypothetical protein
VACARQGEGARDSGHFGLGLGMPGSGWRCAGSGGVPAGKCMGEGGGTARQEGAGARCGRSVQAGVVACRVCSEQGGRPGEKGSVSEREREIRLL